MTEKLQWKMIDGSPGIYDQYKKQKNDKIYYFIYRKIY